MPNYLSPGVYIEEVSTGARPIEAVGTSTAGFVGVAPDQSAYPRKAEAVNNWTEFLKKFGSAGGPSTHLAQAVFGFFLNGGRRCYVVNLGEANTITGDGKGRKGIDLLEEVDEVAIVAAPGFSDVASHEALLSHCEKLRDRVAILDTPKEVADISQLTKVATASVSKPDEDERARSIDGDQLSGLRPRQSDNGFGAIYFPWITVRDPISANELVEVPPSGHMAGVYARTDATRGVHKAPANEVIRGALNVRYRVTHDEQGELNPNGINVIRFFSNEGIRVWGARTVASGSSQWRYLNVRRLFNMIEESIARSTRWIVFEPNDAPLWKSIRRDISAFLTILWRQGALMGQSAEEAFFVKCDEETNTPESIEAGMVIVVVGLAPVKPAEFVIFRVSQGAGGAERESLEEK